MNRILIDTNIYSLALRGKQELVATRRQVNHIGIAVISMGVVGVPPHGSTFTACPGGL